jgi:hypothetical protein
MLYLYTNVCPINILIPHVLRTSDTLYEKAPDWESEHCPPFSDIEDQLIREIVSNVNFNIIPSRGHYGWFRFPDYAVEQLIVGCMACDIELEVIEWTG